VRAGWGGVGQPWGSHGVGSPGSAPVTVSPSPQSLQLPSLGEEDVDVARERVKVGSTPPQSHLLLLKDLTKVRHGAGAAPSLAAGLRSHP